MAYRNRCIRFSGTLGRYNYLFRTSHVPSYSGPFISLQNLKYTAISFHHGILVRCYSMGMFCSPSTCTALPSSFLLFLKLRKKELSIPISVSKYLSLSTYLSVNSFVIPGVSIFAALVFLSFSNYGRSYLAE